MLHRARSPARAAQLPLSRARARRKQLLRFTVKALASPDVKQRLAAQGFDADGNTPEQFTEVIRRALARWQKVIREAKIRVE